MKWWPAEPPAGRDPAASISIDVSGAGKTASLACAMIGTGEPLRPPTMPPFSKAAMAARASPSASPTSAATMFPLCAKIAVAPTAALLCATVTFVAIVWAACDCWPLCPRSFCRTHSSSCLSSICTIASMKLTAICFAASSIAAPKVLLVVIH